MNNSTSETNNLIESEAAETEAAESESVESEPVADDTIENTPASPAVKTPLSWWKKSLIITPLVVLFLVLTAFLAAALYVFNKLELINYSSGDAPSVSYSDSADRTSNPVSSGDIGLNVSPSDILLPGFELHVDKDVTNILLLGTDERASELADDSRADSIMLLSINEASNSIKLISFERAIPVIMPNGDAEILTHAFHYGGPNYVIECIRSHFNVNVDHFIRVNFEVFETLVDAVGGVEITLSEAEAYALNARDHTYSRPLTRPFVSGTSRLNGFEALQYSRLRYIDSDWVRIQRQRTVIKALLDQASTLSLPELDDTITAVLPMLHTNMTKTEVVILFSKLYKILHYPVEDMTIPADGTHSYGCSVIDYEANSRIIEEFIYGSGE